MPEQSHIQSGTTKACGAPAPDQAHSRCVCQSGAEALKNSRCLGRYHIARKLIPSKHGPVHGVKLEQFIFDPFPLAQRFVLFEVLRASEFAPVKNASGAGVSDSPETARLALMRLHREWVVAAGGKVDGGVDAVVEVAPGLSYAGEGLSGRCSGCMFARNSVLN
jgi:UDP-N-acetylglucosamine pyrophosphorylase